jgi:hypothetical protein
LNHPELSHCGIFAIKKCFCIKKKKVIVLIDSSSTHNFIHYKLAKDLNCFVYPMPEFQVMIADGGTINCSGKCNKINITMGEYVMSSPMIVIPMGGADVVLGIQWLQSLGTMAFNFQEIELRGITGKPGKVISSNDMTKLLKKGHVTHPLQHNKIFSFPQGTKSPKSYEGLVQASSPLFTSL